MPYVVCFLPAEPGERKGSVTEKSKKVMGKAKDFVKRVAEAVTPGDENGEYFSNLIKETNERSVKGALRKYFNNLIEETSERSAKRSHRKYFANLLKESNERSTQSLNQRRRTTRVKDTLLVAISQAREGVGQVDNPRAQALLETTAETLEGLVTAFAHYEQEAEKAWQPA